MEHEVFVPVTPELLRQTLADPARVARCVPGLQQDADAAAGPLAGRLRVRVGGHTITYRGALRLTGTDDTWTVEGEGNEARGPGGVKLTLSLRLTPAEGGTTLTVTGTATADGRLADVPPDTATTAAHRLLDRLASALAEEAGRTEADVEAGPADAGTADGAPSGAVPEARAEDDGGPAAEAEADPDADETTGPRAADADDASDADVSPEVPASDAPEPASVFEVPVPPSSLEPLLDDEFDAEPPAEAAHARRTMIGRSAEEVDHAPPRGRYAPVPAPEAARAGAALRWVAPAAALAIASAVVVGRALRRRR
ncbi:SRPBCC family protein [Streptomyces tritici]|uniref:SRPBCC family protein n=1 Tax=Streptomyces tritici TaxID=2054410 RepID=UPI003AEF5773